MKVCNKCGTTCRGWHSQVDGHWRLANMDGSIHDCQPAERKKNASAVVLIIEGKQAEWLLYSIQETLPQFIEQTPQKVYMRSIEAKLINAINQGSAGMSEEEEEALTTAPRRRRGQNI